MLTRPKLPTWSSLVLSICAGLLIGLGQAPLSIWPAPIIGVALFTWLLAQRKPGASFGLGYLAGLAMNTLTVSWISVLGVPVGIALVCFLSLWWGLLGWVTARVTKLRYWPIVVPAAWVAMEFASGKIPFGGFSWTRLGFTAIDQPLSGWFAWIGASGVSYLVALVGCLVLWAIAEPKRRVSGIAVALALFLIGGALNLVPKAAPEEQLTVALVQPGVNRAEKGTASYARSVTNNALSETVHAVAQARANGQELDFIVWPENATDVDPISDEPTRELVELAVEIAQVPIFVGAVTDGPEPDTRQTTSIWWDPVSGPGEKYHKRDLVPFGEWIPFRDVLLPRLPILKQIGRQSIPGEGPGVVQVSAGGYDQLSVGTIICFELAYDDTSYDLIRNGAEIIVSQSNTNTYAATFQIPQQLTLNRVRAMELGRDVIATTLNSTSALVSPSGQVSELTQEFTAATRIVDVPLRHNQNLSIWVGPGIAWLCVTATVVVVGLSFLRKKQSDQ